MNPPDNSRERFCLIDALRGIAAAMVLVQHLYSVGPMYRPLSRLIPGPISAALECGYLGVHIFFVLSGFVIAYSQREIAVDGRYLGNFALRRSLRLDPPYWLAIVLVLTTDFVSNLALVDRVVGRPDVVVILANMFYLHDILGVDAILGPSWTLCLEVQFYLVLTVLVGIAQRLPTASRWILGCRHPSLILVFTPPAVLSFLHAGQAFGLPDRGAFFPPFWYMFFYGVLIWWAIEGTLAASWFWSYSCGLTVCLICHWTPEMAMVLATGLLIYVGARLDRLHNSLNGATFQFFGRISYSLYLVHVPVGDRLLNFGKRITGDSVVAAVVWFALAFALSVAAAFVMYHFVERPGMALGRRLGSRYRLHDLARLPLLFR